MDAFWLALVIVLLLEGLGPLLFPNKWQRYLARLAQEPVASLRQIGAVLCGAAVLIYVMLV
jgi:hypothetical protein